MQRLAILLTLVLTLGMSQYAAAQRPGGHGPGPRLLEQLDLSDTQRAQLKTLRAQHRAEMEALRTKEFADRRARMEAMRSLRTKGKTEMDAILTEAQQTKMRELVAKHRAERPKVDRKALRKDVNTYRKDNIKPVMRAQRAKLETVLSAEDKALIAELRPKAKAAKQELRTGMRALKGERKAGERPDREKLHAQRKALEAKYAAEIKQLETLVQKYQLDIDRLLAEVETEQLEWKEELRDIMQEHAGERTKPGKHRRPHAEGAHPHKPGRRGRARMKNLTKAHFLLLRPAGIETTNEAGTNGLGVFPNPAADRVTLRYDLAADGPVQIVLKNAEGKQLRNVLNETQAAGAQRTTLDVSDLPTGVYYLHVQQGDDQRTQRFVVGNR